MSNWYPDGIFPLGTDTTVYQAEVFAVLQAAYTLAPMHVAEASIDIFVDSLSTVQALGSAVRGNQQMCECCMVLNSLALQHAVTLHWIPAHCGYLGNETADGLAKEAAETQFLGPEPVIL